MATPSCSPYRTKWIEVAPLRRPTAANVTRALTDRLIYRHGCPQWLISDNEKLLATFGIRHRVTPPYNSQCNPVERANRTFKTMVAQYVGRNQKTWNEHIAALQYAYNTAWHEELGNTPAHLNH
ncbi:reverse ribonuclease integrase [Lasius niger]|uniref:Reverse ribonuclease integrase n=1 Tax=Lasius niger TaxID=67767 RepID=A0A0J7KLX8_LASNI|nr:reverse ribonuclease integrase [Lasius niger]